MNYRLSVRVLKFGLALAVALWLLVPGVAQAHAHLVRADPDPESVIAHAPAVASFEFDQPLNPALTSVRVLDAGGRQVAGDGGYIAPGHGGILWLLPLPFLRDGTYSVLWTSEAALDGHIMSSFYSFRIGAPAGVGARAAGPARAPDGQMESDGPLGLDLAALSTALWHWLGLEAQALWLGALIVDMVVLVPRRREGDAPEARLSRAAAPRLWWLVRIAVGVTLAALCGEVLSLALQGTGGDWARATTPATLGGILSSQYGHYVLARCATLCLALLFVAGQPVVLQGDGQPMGRPERPHPLGMVASPLATWRVPSPRVLLTFLAVDELLLVAYSGHAADVSPGWLSYPIDWMHLLCMAAWAGGIAALAYGVVPCRRTLPAGQQAPAVLALLDRYSPVAFAAVGLLALSGVYNAVSHIDTPSVLVGTAYGNLLIVKIALVALLMALSASHVFGLRPRMSQIQASRSHDAMAVVGKRLVLLATLLRVEAGVGAAILLITALMGQTLPSQGAVARAGGATGTAAPTAVQSSIAGTATVGELRARLVVAPPVVGPVTFTLRLWERGTPITEENGIGLIHIFPAARPWLRANLTTQGHGTVFTARGSLALSGIWRADVLARTATLRDYRTLPFTFTVGLGATFLTPGPAAPAEPGGPAISFGLAIARTLPYTAIVSETGSNGVRPLQGRLLRTGSQPYGVTMLPGTDDAYVTHFGGARGTVTRIDLRAMRVVDTYAVGLGPARIAFTPDRRRAFVTNFRSNDVSAIDLDSGASRRVSFPDNYCFEPYGVDVSEDGRTVYVACAGGAYIYTLGAETLRPGRPVMTGRGATDVVVNRPRHEVWVANAVARTVTVLDERTLHGIAAIPTGQEPVALRPTPDGRVVYVTDRVGSAVIAIDAARRRVIASVPVPAQPNGLDVTVDGRYVYVVSIRGGSVTIISTSGYHVIAVVPSGGDPNDVAIAR